MCTINTIQWQNSTVAAFNGDFMEVFSLLDKRKYHINDQHLRLIILILFTEIGLCVSFINIEGLGVTQREWGNAAQERLTVALHLPYRLM